MAIQNVFQEGGNSFVNGTNDREAHVKFWIAALVQMNCEKKSEAKLNSLGFETYLPIQKEEHQWSDRRKIIDRIVIPMIVFVHVDKEHVQSVRNLSFVHKLIVYPGSKEIVTPIPDEQIDQLRFLLSNAESEVSIISDIKVGDEVGPSAWLGEVEENHQPLKIMVPFQLTGTYKVKSVVPEGDYTIEDTVVVLSDKGGEDIKVNMIQKWPVKKAMTNYVEKPRPYKLLETGVRVIDTMNPIVEGGTGFIPGPFGTGKTVLQHAISKQAEADIVIIAACGERANEVVEIFTEFPELVDPHTGRKLMERTIIVANTSNMPVAAREASVYTAMTMAEFYRAMGLKVLLMADSTSRWAQALREMSNRMEELPGPDAFPMDISAIISNFYGRAGFVHLYNGATGSITFIGTVSPAGGNLKEPVTENTKKVARCFYALEQERADRKRYPAVNPIDSYSKYLEYPEFEDYITERINNQWTGKVNELKTRLLRGKEIAEQINILGDDGVPVEYHVIFWKSELIDFVILQQDAFDEVDSVTPMERQEDIVNMVIDICHTNFKFETFVEVMDYFKKMINICKQMNYSKYKSEQYEDFRKQLATLVAERSVK